MVLPTTRYLHLRVLVLLGRLLGCLANLPRELVRLGRVDVAAENVRVRAALDRVDKVGDLAEERVVVDERVALLVVVSRATDREVRRVVGLGCVSIDSIRKVDKVTPLTSIKRMWNPSPQTSISQSYVVPWSATVCMNMPTAPLSYFHTAPEMRGMRRSSGMRDSSMGILVS